MCFCVDRRIVPLNQQMEYNLLVPYTSNKTRNVELQRRAPSYGFGFSIRGGREHGTGFFVSHVEINSDAFFQGLKVGVTLTHTPSERNERDDFLTFCMRFPVAGRRPNSQDQWLLRRVRHSQGSFATHPVQHPPLPPSSQWVTFFSPFLKTYSLSFIILKLYFYSCQAKFPKICPLIIL